MDEHLIASLERLSRSELQQRAKALGIRANQKSSDLINAIASSQVYLPLTPKTPAQVRRILDVQNSGSNLANNDRIYDSPLNAFTRPPRDSWSSCKFSEEAISEGKLVSSVELGSGHIILDESDRLSINTHKSENQEVVSASVSIETENASQNIHNTTDAFSDCKSFNLKDALCRERERRRSAKKPERKADESVWQLVQSKSKPGQYYYWNPLTEKSSWSLPLND
jgi:hypothetical protein